MFSISENYVNQKVLTFRFTIKKTAVKAVSNNMAGIQGFEPRQTDPETGVLPLDDIPVYKMAG